MEYPHTITLLPFIGPEITLEHVTNFLIDGGFVNVQYLTDGHERIRRFAVGSIEEILHIPLETS